MWGKNILYKRFKSKTHVNTLKPYKVNFALNSLNLSFSFTKVNLEKNIISYLL